MYCVTARCTGEVGRGGGGRPRLCSGERRATVARRTGPYYRGRAPGVRSADGVRWAGLFERLGLGHPGLRGRRALTDRPGGAGRNVSKMSMVMSCHVMEAITASRQHCSQLAVS